MAWIFLLPASHAERDSLLRTEAKVSWTKRGAKAFQAEDNSKCKRKNFLINDLIVTTLSSGKGI